MRTVPRVALFSVSYLRSCCFSTYGAIHFVHSDSIFDFSLRSKVYLLPVNACNVSGKVNLGNKIYKMSYYKIP